MNRARKAGDISRCIMPLATRAQSLFFSRKPTASAVGYGYGVGFADSAFLRSARSLPFLEYFCWTHADAIETGRSVDVEPIFHFNPGGNGLAVFEGGFELDFAGGFDRFFRKPIWESVDDLDVLHFFIRCQDGAHDYDAMRHAAPGFLRVSRFRLLEDLVLFIHLF